MWHKTKNIKKNWVTFFQQATPKVSNSAKGISLTKEQREENGQAREQLKDKEKYLGNHFYRPCKSKSG